MKLPWIPSLWPTLLACTALLSDGTALWAQAPDVSREPTNFLPSAQFKIPFNIEMLNGDLKEVQLWVSTDEGETWQMHGSAQPGDRWFDFKAAAEGMYLFSVQTIDAAGNAFPSPNPPLRVYVDTSKPRAALRADINSVGQLVAELQIADDNLLPESAVLKCRTDRDPNWQELPLGQLVEQHGVFRGELALDLPPCREVALAFLVRDRANNTGEATYTYVMPRTAGRDMTLASTGGQSQPGRIPTIGGAQRWEPPSASNPPPTAPQSAPTQFVELARPGKLAGRTSLELEPADGLRGPGMELPQQAEELPLPAAVGSETLPSPRAGASEELRLTEPASLQSPPSSGIVSHGNTPDRAFHCKSRAFSLDYSVEALGGTSLSDIELWGTEDSGRTWQKWGSDPDRTSPFDVQVGIDGLFGFRMVVIAGNGLVSNRPRDGDNADMWINVDTSIPTAKITRAVYGEGDAEGMLVIDYTCNDQHLVDRPITLSYSERPGGPWTDIASGLDNTGTYRWKASPQLPEKIYVRLECVDKSGNIGEHRLDVPIDTRGLGPRGRIQGFRPIFKPN